MASDLVHHGQSFDDQPLGFGTLAIHLGNGVDAPVLLHWLIEQHLDGHLDCTKIVTVGVHSANPVGRENLLGLWVSFMYHLED